MSSTTGEITGLAGREVCGYQLLNEIGRGNTGIVYLAHQLSLDRDVAFKVLLPEYSNDPEYLANFMREARIAARLDHRNIVQALDVGTAPEGWTYFAMEYVQGRSLEDIRVENPEIISLRFLLDVSIQLADALNYAWESFHMTHGDIKPGNLLLRNSDKMLKLADLGLANIAGSDTIDGEIMATPMYAAPEVIQGNGRGNGVKSDLYSFGVMFYELAGGTAPFHGDIDDILHSHLTEKPRPLIEMNPDLDREVSDFVDRLLAKLPDDRPADWIAVKEFMRRFRDKLSIRAATAGKAVDLAKLAAANTPAPMSDGAKQLLAALITLAVAVGALLLAALIWLIFR